MKTKFARLVALLILSLFMTVTTARAADESEPASTSKLVGIRLPAGAHRVIDNAAVAQAVAPLDQSLGQLTTNMKMRMQLVAPELLAWDKKRSAPAQVMAAVAKNLRQAGYSYKTLDLPAQGGNSAKMVVSGASGKGIVGLWITTGDIMALAWGRIAPRVAVGGATLVEGTPLLTLGMVNRHADMMSWVLGLGDLNDEQRQTLQALSGALMGEAWQRNNADHMVAYLGALADYNHRNRMAPAEADWKRQYWMSEWRKAAKRPGAGAELQALLQLVEARDAVLVQGKSGGAPLTTTTRDAYVDLAAFAMSRLTNGPVQLSNEEKKNMAAWITTQYPNFSPAEQNTFSEMPLQWATLRAAWPQQNGAARTALLKKWQPMFGPMARAFGKQRAADKSYAALLSAAGNVRNKVNKGSIKPADYERLASLQESTAKVLRNAGGTANLKLANELLGYAKQERARAKSLRSSRTATTARHSTMSSSASMRMLNAYSSMSNFQNQMQAMRFNMIANIGNNPYRYEIRY